MVSSYELIERIASEMYKKEGKEIVREVNNVWNRVKRMKRGKKKHANQLLDVVKRSLLLCLIRGDEESFYKLFKVKKEIEGSLKGNTSTF